jgi:hypothetical protein
MLEKVGHAEGIDKPMGDWQSEHDYQKRANGFWQIVVHPLKYTPIPYQTFGRKQESIPKKKCRGTSVGRNVFPRFLCIVKDACQ